MFITFWTPFIKIAPEKCSRFSSLIEKQTKKSHGSHLVRRSNKTGRLDHTPIGVIYLVFNDFVYIKNIGILQNLVQIEENLRPISDFLGNLTEGRVRF